jgi:Family of unknown function (DUF6296)
MRCEPMCRVTAGTKGRQSEPLKARADAVAGSTLEASAGAATSLPERVTRMRETEQGEVHVSRYELLFQEPGRETETVLVHRTDRTGPGGNPVYTDETGIVQAEISPQAEVRIIHTSGYQQPPTVKAVRVSP